MKLSTLAALSSCALLANGQPVLNDKRALVYETYVTEVVQTEYEFVTVWVTPGQAVAEAPQTTSSSSQHNHEAYHSSLQSLSSSVTPAAATVSVAPVSVTPVSVTPASVTPDSVTPDSVTPASVTPVSVTPVSVTPVVVSVTPVSVTPVAVSVTPVSVTPVPVSVTPASVTPVSITPEVSVTPVSVTPVSVTPVSVTPVTEQPAPTSTAATNNYGTSSGGACGDIGGQCTGDATFYDVYSTDYTACGTHVDGQTDDIFAIAAGENDSRIFSSE